MGDRLRSRSSTVKRRQKKWTVDWAGEREPAVGDVVRHVTATKKQTSYWRVTAVRLMRHTAPLPAGYSARYKVSAEPISEGRGTLAVSWTLQAWAMKPKTHDTDRFSPLI